MATKGNSGGSRTPTTRPGYRDARDGQFTTRREAEKDPAHHVKERVPLPGHGDTKKK